MNLFRPRRWENKRAKRSVGWLMLLTVLTLCLVTMSRGGRAAPPPLTGPTIGDLMQKSATFPVASAPLSPSSKRPRSHHPMSISIGNGGVSITTREKPATPAETGPNGGATGVPAASSPDAPDGKPEVAASPDTTDKPKVTSPDTSDRKPELAASPDADGKPEVAETPDRKPEAAASPETPDGKPEAVASPETPDGKPDVAASPDTPDGKPEGAASPETPDGKPEVAASPVASPVVETPVAASTPWDPNAEGGGNSSIFISKLQQMVIMLFLVGFLAFACLKVMSRYLPGMAAGGKRVKQLEVLERQALATGATVSLVRVGKKFLVLGQTEQNVNTLCELTADQLEDQPAEAPQEAATAPPVASMSFHGDILRHYLSIFPGFGPGSKGGV